jgi:hypothetical protein
VALAISKKLALTSLTSGGRSVGIVRLRTQATEVFIIIIILLLFIYLHAMIEMMNTLKR